jgi:hypothetical protein
LVSLLRTSPRRRGASGRRRRAPGTPAGGPGWKGERPGLLAVPSRRGPAGS